MKATISTIESSRVHTGGVIINLCNQRLFVLFSLSVSSIKHIDQAERRTRNYIITKEQ